MWWVRVAIMAVFVQAGFAQTPSPSLLVVNKNANELAIVDPSTMKVVGRVPVGDGPHEVATDGRLAYVTNYGSQTAGNSISVIDLDNVKELKRLDLGTLQRPHGIVIDGGKVYFTAEGTTGKWTNASATRPPDLKPPDGFVSSYDPSGESGWGWSTGEYGTHMLVISKDGKKVFTSNIRSNSVSVFDRTPGFQGTVIEVGKGPEGLDISPDGREVWVAHSGDGGVSIISADTMKVLATFSISTKRSNRLKFTPDGRRVFISDMDGDEVVVLDAKSHNQIKRIRATGHPEGIQMSPDGLRAFVALSQEGAIATIDLKTLEITSKSPTGPGADGMAWAQ
jgi:YVTN family beta-propeller protein